MRIRQVRPEFFTDRTMACLSPEVRLTYIGLWLVADDAGWLRMDVAQIGALLFPFESVKRREHRLQESFDRLIAAGRLVCYGCGCASIPTLEKHQKIGGTKSFTVRDEHRKHAQSIDVRTDMDESARNVTLGNGKVGNGSDAPKAPTDERLLDAFRRQGLPVDTSGPH